MSFEIHLTIQEESEQGHLIASLSARERITPSEAVEQILNQAVEGKIPTARRPMIPGLPSVPLNDEEAAMMDEIVAEAMAARMRRLERHSRA